MKNIWIFNHYAAPPSLIGAVRHYNFAKYLQRNGYQVTVFVSSAIHNSDINMIKDKTPFIEQKSDGVSFVYIKTRSYRGNGRSRVLNMLDYYRGLLHCFREFSVPDVIYASSVHPLTCIAGIRIASKMSVPCICEVRDLWPLSIVEYSSINPRNPIIWALYKMEKWIYKKADSLIFTMEGGKDYIIEKGWDNVVDINKVYHINNGVDLESYRMNESLEYVPDSDLDNSKFKAIYAGAMRKANGIESFLHVAKILKEREKTDIQFIMYGNDEDGTLQAQAEAMGLSNITFKGSVSKKDIPGILARSDVNILHYKAVDAWKYGGSQNKLFEYFAAGKPVLSDIQMGYDVIKKYGAGIISKSQAPDDIADAICSIANADDAEYERYCAGALKAAEAYDFQVLTEKLIIVIEQLLLR